MTNLERFKEHIENCSGCDISMTDFLREDILAFWQSRSELFPIPDCFVIGHVAEGGECE